jgi:methionyl-tRNA formyltransferase
MGTYNVHGSLLPKYRGAAPIHWAVINGEVETGVTTFKLKHDIDTGDWVLQNHLAIGPDETTGSVYNRLMALGADALIETAHLLESGAVTFHPQVDLEATHAPKLTTENTQINWDSDARSIHNFIRGLNPLPTAWTLFNGEKMKVFSSRFGAAPSGPFIEIPPFCVADKKLWAKTHDGWLQILEVQPAGRKRMDATAFVNGLSLTPR